jgi:hypothetical protein
MRPIPCTNYMQDLAQSLQNAEMLINNSQARVITRSTDGWAFSEKFADVAKAFATLTYIIAALPKGRKKEVDATTAGPGDIDDNFHNMSVFPTESMFDDDVSESWRRRKHLLPSLSAGPFEDARQLVGTNFMLLREDAMQSFREAIAELHRTNSIQKCNKHARMFEDISVAPPKFGRRGVVTCLALNHKRDKNTRWLINKKLMVGNLVGLSCDRFFSSVFGVIVSRPTGVIYSDAPVLEVELFSDDALDRLVLHAICAFAGL